MSPPKNGSNSSQSFEKDGSATDSVAQPQPKTDSVAPADGPVLEGEILPPEPGAADAYSARQGDQEEPAKEAPPQKVLQVMAGARHGGAEAFFERMVAALHRAGLRQRVIIRRDAGRAARLKAAGLEVAQLPFGIWFDFSTQKSIAQEIDRFEPDLVFSWMNRAASRVPREVPGLRFVHAARLGGYYDLKYYAGCDHLVGNTRDLVHYFTEKRWPAERAHYLPNFVSGDIQTALQRANLGTPADHNLLLALGRLHRNKGFDILIDALARLPNCSLWLAGEGPERRRLQRQIDRLGLRDRVRLLGWRDDVPALLASADLFVCSSRHEPLGNMIIEAWAQTKPVVSLAAQGPAELIRDAENGLLVPLENPMALATAIQRVLGDPLLYDSIAAGGRKAYEAEFTEARVVERYLEFIERVTFGLHEIKVEEA